jgi:hypothetical protein
MMTAREHFKNSDDTAALLKELSMNRFIQPSQSLFVIDTIIMPILKMRNPRYHNNKLLATANNDEANKRIKVVVGSIQYTQQPYILMFPLSLNDNRLL